MTRTHQGAVEQAFFDSDLYSYSEFLISRLRMLRLTGQSRDSAVIMPPKVSRQTKHDALELISRGISLPDAVDTFQASRRTIQRADRRLKKYGDIEGGYQKRGPKGKIDYAMTMVLTLQVYDHSNHV